MIRHCERVKGRRGPSFLEVRLGLAEQYSENEPKGIDMSVPQDASRESTSSNWCEDSHRSSLRFKDAVAAASCSFNALISFGSAAAALLDSAFSGPRDSIKAFSRLLTFVCSLSLSVVRLVMMSFWAARASDPAGVD